jgi:DNA polymerase-1
MTHPVGPDSRVTLVDGSGYIFRAFHGLPPLTRKSDGAPIGAVSGFCNMIFKLLADERDGDQPTHLAVIFDASGPTFRNDIYPAYKANRPPAPEDLVPQFPMIREATRAFGLPSIELAGYEADDLIATYARQAAEKGAKVRILSSDKDLMQLIADKIFLYDPMKDRPMGPEAVMEKFGVAPEQVIDVQSLAGDSTDNVPGAPGIGVKTAAELLGIYGNLETLLDRAEEIKQPKRRETLIQFREQIEISKRLVTLMDNVPVLEHLEHFGVREPEPTILLDFLRNMELRTLTGRVEAGLRRDGFVADKAEHSQPAPVSSIKAVPSRSEDSAPTNHAVIPAAVYSPIDTKAYETITSLARLDDWLARIQTQGYVAFDTETASLNSVSGHLVGLSLAVEPGIACYIPLGHRGAGDVGVTGDLFGGGQDTVAKLPGQLELADVLARLKPILEDDAILNMMSRLWPSMV